MIKLPMEDRLLRLLASLPPRVPERLLTVIAFTFIALGALASGDFGWTFGIV
jgi:hypothetical protein